MALNAQLVADGWRGLLQEGDRILSLMPSDIVPVGDLIVGVADLLDLVIARAYPYAEGVSGWDRILTLWTEFEPTVVFGAPGVLRELTKLLLHRDALACHAETVRLLMMLGEVCPDSMRVRMGQWWSATAVDASYGSTETGTLAVGCAEGGLHLLPKSSFFEVVDVHHGRTVLVGPDLPEEVEGNLVVTPLNAHARPLLRFDMGDRVTVGGACRCGHNSPRLVVHGRSSETIEVPGGELGLRDVEDCVYSTTSALGYMVEVDDLSKPTKFRVALERNPGADREAEEPEGAALGYLLAERLGLDEPIDVAWFNSLPAVTRSGAAQKNWKRSNMRQVDW